MPDIAPIRLAFRGLKQTLTPIIGRGLARSPSYWFGPDVPAGGNFAIQLHSTQIWPPMLFSTDIIIDLMVVLQFGDSDRFGGDHLA
jgi:hypothetical protein